MGKFIKWNRILQTRVREEFRGHFQQLEKLPTVAYSDFDKKVRFVN